MNREEIREDILDLFYPFSSGQRMWGGWVDFFEPHIPSRLYGEGFRCLRLALDDPENTHHIVQFLSQSHMKYLSKSGCGSDDVLCVPTEKAQRAVELFKKYEPSRSSERTPRRPRWAVFLALMVVRLRRLCRRPWYAIHVDDDFNVVERWFWTQRAARRWAQSFGQEADGSWRANYAYIRYFPSLDEDDEDDHVDNS